MGYEYQILQTKLEDTKVYGVWGVKGIWVMG